ncbi:MAG: SURF1 family protein [Cellvibrio sp.]|uniref:SURF1 family protein n=1 Tax=Cellvibrio sp. TaxID=1965322 RepID=UPI0027271A50|nr:SURF1 family protein [Cellvibrio sp.]
MTIIAFNRYWVVRWPWVLVNLLVVGLLLGLCFWQLSRATEKSQTLARIADWQQQGAIGSAQLSQIHANAIDGVQLDFNARWLSPNVWLWDNQIVNGRFGYDVIIAVEEIMDRNQVDNSIQKESPAVVLVNLGWLAAPLARDQLPAVDIPAELRVQGIYRTRIKGLLLGANVEDEGSWPMRIQQLDTLAFSNYLQRPLHSGVIYQQKDSPFLVHYRPVILPPERHRAYALQWGLLALAVIVIALAASARKELLHD